VIHQLLPGGARPYFAEIPYYLWGQVNYDSDGDCNRPRDRNWTWMDLKNRESRERISIETPTDGDWSVDGDEPAASRAALFLASRSGARADAHAPAPDGGWDHAAAAARAAAVAREFERSELDLFDSLVWWGSWKWIGWFATDFTWVGRWIMHSVVTRDVRAVNLCIEWLRDRHFPEHAIALQGALKHLTGENHATNAAWLRWYDGSDGRPAARDRYPEPDVNAWLVDLKSQAT
jgi:hypothetical protein